MKSSGLILIFILLLSVSSCRLHEADDSGPDYEKDKFHVEYPDAGAAKTKTLLTAGYFVENEIKEGIMHYQFNSKFDDVSGAVQNVNVLEVDLNNESYKITFKYTDRDSTSAIGRRFGAIAAVNATYEQDATYCRVNGVNHSEVSVLPCDPDESKALRFWKHEAAIVSDGERRIGMIHGAKGQDDVIQGGIQASDIYDRLSEPDIFSGAPMLIDAYDPVGARFVPAVYDDFSIDDFERNFESEDYRRHQGVRHPRTAVALTEDNDILFIVVDGRFEGKASGMSARELTNFLIKHFNPKWAVNFDGGGSSTMYIDSVGEPADNVVNYPCDDGDQVWDHIGQRLLSTFFLVEYDS